MKKKKEERTEKKHLTWLVLEPTNSLSIVKCSVPKLYEDDSSWSPLDAVRVSRRGYPSPRVRFKNHLQIAGVASWLNQFPLEKCP